MTYLIGVFAIVLVIGTMAYFVRKAGRDAERANSFKKTTDNVADAKLERDDVRGLSADDRRARLRGWRRK